MNIFFILFIWVDLLVLYYFFREAFVVRSNMRRKYRTRFFLLLLFTAGAIVAKYGGFSMAWWMAGVPAILAVLFFGGLAVAMFRFKGPWR